MIKNKHIFTITLSIFLHTLCISQTVKDTSKVTTPIYSDPMFPGGPDSMHVFFSRNFNKVIPDSCRQGKVYVSFTIDTSGFVKDIKVLRGLCKPLDEEAVRLIFIMPQWIPAREFIDNKSKPIETKFNLPVKFSMN